MSGKRVGHFVTPSHVSTDLHLNRVRTSETTVCSTRPPVSVKMFPTTVPPHPCRPGKVHARGTGRVDMDKEVLGTDSCGWTRGDTSRLDRRTDRDQSRFDDERRHGTGHSRTSRFPELHPGVPEPLPPVRHVTCWGPSRQDYVVLPQNVLPL